MSPNQISRANPVCGDERPPNETTYFESAKPRSSIDSSRSPTSAELADVCSSTAWGYAFLSGVRLRLEDLSRLGLS
eukprot:1524734-Pyramimonas_sp.AAC.1